MDSAIEIIRQLEEIRKRPQFIFVDSIYPSQTAKVRELVLSYIKENPNHKEIDFILEIKNRIIPIESKVKKLPETDELEILKRFMKGKASTGFGIITTDESLEIKENILLIPCYILAMLL